jgi:hypothetical protein
MIDEREIIKVFESSGFRCTHRLVKVIEFQSERCIVYLDRERSYIYIYIEPSLPELSMPGAQTRHRQNADLRKFPMNLQRTSRCAWGVQIDNQATLADVLSWVKASCPILQ